MRHFDDCALGDGDGRREGVLLQTVILGFIILILVWLSRVFQIVKTMHSLTMGHTMLSDF